jgi:hypothetical protein
MSISEPSCESSAEDLNVAFMEDSFESITQDTKTLEHNSVNSQLSRINSAYIESLSLNITAMLAQEQKEALKKVEEQPWANPRRRSASKRGKSFNEKSKVSTSKLKRTVLREHSPSPNHFHPFHAPSDEKERMEEAEIILMMIGNELEGETLTYDEVINSKNRKRLRPKK